MPSRSIAPIVGIGELLWDLLPAGARLGGATTNFALLCARLGNPAALVSRTGRDALGTDALAQLAAVAEATPFDLSHIQQSPLLPTGTVSVTLDTRGSPHYTIDAPVAWDEITLTPGLLALAAHASAVCFGTLAQRTDPSRTTLRTLVETTSPACIRVCDMNLRMPFCTPEVAHWSLAHASVLKVSDEELPQLSSLLKQSGALTVELKPAPSDAAALTLWATEAAHTLLAAAPLCQLLAITLGPHGSLLADRSSTQRHPGFSIKVADTIGAGDAFTAGLLHAYRHHTTLDRIGAVANLCGSYVASQQGATPPFPAELLTTIQTTLGKGRDGSSD